MVAEIFWAISRRRDSSFSWALARGCSKDGLQLGVGIHELLDRLDFRGDGIHRFLFLGHLQKGHGVFFGDD